MTILINILIGLGIFIILGYLGAMFYVWWVLNKEQRENEEYKKLIKKNDN